MFIKLTLTNGYPVWINPALVTDIELRDMHGTYIFFCNGDQEYDTSRNVKETPEEIMELITGKTTEQRESDREADQLTNAFLGCMR